MMTSHLQQDDCDAVTRVLLAQLIQKSVPDVSATEYFKPSQLVDLIHQNTKSFGVFHPGYRAVHANGRFYAGTFAPTPQAKTLSRALHLQDDRAPVTSRFSFGSGNVDDAPNGVVAMATRFYLPDGTYTNLLRDTKKASHVNVEDYDAIYFTGAVCHGPAGLLEVTLDNGESLVKGKNVTGFSRPEEVVAQRADTAVQPAGRARTSRRQVQRRRQTLWHPRRHRRPTHHGPEPGQRTRGRGGRGRRTAGKVKPSWPTTHSDESRVS